MENELAYFQRRASQEKAAALHAAHPRARQAHWDMARQYDHLIRRFVADERRLKMCLPPRVSAEPTAVDAPLLERLGLSDRPCV